MGEGRMTTSTPHPGRYRLGVSSLARILTRRDPRRRLVDEALLLEWLLAEAQGDAANGVRASWRARFAPLGDAAAAAGEIAERELFTGCLRDAPSHAEVV